LKVIQEVGEAERPNYSRQIGLADLLKDLAMVLNREEPDGFCGDKHQPANIDWRAWDGVRLLTHDFKTAGVPIGAHGSHAERLRLSVCVMVKANCQGLSFCGVCGDVAVRRFCAVQRQVSYKERPISEGQ